MSQQLRRWNTILNKNVVIVGHLEYCIYCISSWFLFLSVYSLVIFPSAPLLVQDSAHYSWTLHIADFTHTLQNFKSERFLKQMFKWMMLYFYRAIIDSILTFSITSGSLLSSPRIRTGCRESFTLKRSWHLPSFYHLHASRTVKQTGKILADPYHPWHGLFVTLLSSRRLWSIRTKTSHQKKFLSLFYIGLINMSRDPQWFDPHYKLH